LFEEQNEEAPPTEYWEEHCSFKSASGDIFFVGGLETV
jgi:hypothetical protein